MQIVRNLAGYSFGRSDLVRRAMSKKKAKVMEAERQNFIYGNEEEGVQGCIAGGIPENVANKIYDEMIDFAKYAFNKSHAAAYAVVAYQTAYLKYHHPVEFMAALMTSVKDNTVKITDYSMHCREMEIQILPPDINTGYAVFSVDQGNVRYGMAAVKGVGTQVVQVIVNERLKRGEYRSLQDFIERINGKDVNKTVIANLIKAGAMDSLDGNRQQKILVYQHIMENVAREHKDNLAGQISLFDLGDEDLAASKEIPFPNVEEYEPEELLAMEKEVLGIYISGHPLQNYADLMEKNCSNNSADFLPEDEGGNAGMPRVQEGENVIIGGIIETKTVKTTKTNTLMAFLTLEDMYGTVEVIVFPRDYERRKDLLEEGAKVFVCGRAQVEEERGGKVICQNIIPFEQVPCELWVRFQDKETYLEQETDFLRAISPYDGRDQICVYLDAEKQIKRLSRQYQADARKIVADQVLVEFPGISGGKEEVLAGRSVAIREKSIEKN